MAPAALPREIVGDTAIELVLAPDPILETFYSLHASPGQRLEVVEPTREMRCNLADALELLRRVAPRLHEYLVESVRSIVLFTSRSTSSFAAVGMHGMLFLNVNARARPTVPFFLDGLVHQGGHVLFSEATMRRTAYFSCPPDARLRDAVGCPDRRTAYGLLHGLFTEYALVATLPAALELTEDPLVRHELRGRIALAFRRFDSDMKLARLHSHKFLSRSGVGMLQIFRRELDRLDARAVDLDALDTDCQPNDFDLDLFLSRNPLEDFMQLNLNQVGLPTLDVRHSVDFYRSLGFETVVDTPDYARFRTASGAATFSLLKVQDEVRAGVSVYFEVEDVAACFEELSSRGVAFTHGPVNQPWGWTEARLFDPSGNRLCIFHAGASRLQPTTR